MNAIGDSLELENETNILRQKLVEYWNQVPYTNRGYKHYYGYQYYPNGLCKSPGGGIRAILPSWELPTDKLVAPNYLTRHRKAIAGYAPVWYQQLRHYHKLRLGKFPEPLDVVLAQVTQQNEQLSLLNGEELNLLNANVLSPAEDAYNGFIQLFHRVYIDFRDRKTFYPLYFLNQADLESLSAALEQREQNEMYYYLRDIRCSSKTHVGFHVNDTSFQLEELTHVVTQLREITDPSIRAFLTAYGVMSADTYLAEVN